MNYIKNILLAILLFHFCILNAQIVDNNYAFQNGIYHSIEELKNDKPSVYWNDVETDIIVLEISNKAQISFINKLEKEESLSLDSIWGFCVNGTPYIKVFKDTTNQFYTFAALQIRGSISYYEYEYETVESYEISAYNPLNKKPFRTKTIERKVTKTKKMMLSLEGKSKELNDYNVEKWISSDKQLLHTFKETERNTRNKQLLKFIQIFNDRNEFVINK